MFSLTVQGARVALPTVNGRCRSGWYIGYSAVCAEQIRARTPQATASSKFDSSLEYICVNVPARMIYLQPDFLFPEYFYNRKLRIIPQLQRAH